VEFIASGKIWRNNAENLKGVGRRKRKKDYIKRFLRGKIFKRGPKGVRSACSNEERE